jgi:hypothetical protein
MDTAYSLTISDETATGKRLNEVILHFPSRITTVKEIVELRVRNEVAAYNNKRGEYFQGLVQPTESEKTINGFKVTKIQQIDAEKQVYTALDAFNKNGYFVLIDNIQAETLEQQVIITDETHVSFIKLTPLVGG